MSTVQCKVWSVEFGVEYKMLNVIQQWKVRQVEWGQDATSTSSSHAMRNGTKGESNIAARAAVPLQKAAIASTKVSQILRLPRKMRFHARRIRTKRCTYHTKQPATQVARCDHVTQRGQCDSPKNTQLDTSKVLRLPRKMTMDMSKVLRLPGNCNSSFANLARVLRLSRRTTLGAL